MRVLRLSSAVLAGLSITAASQASQPKLTPSEQFHLRNMCSIAAQKAFQAHWSHLPGGTVLLGFTNHYDVTTNRCYLLVTYKEGKMTWFDVSDVQTGKRQAHIVLDSPKSDAPTSSRIGQNSRSSSSP